MPKIEDIEIRETTADDFADIIEVEKLAFDHNAEAEITAELLSDASAEPRLSLLAFIDQKAVGHILFTRAQIEGADPQPLAYILAPMAVIPEVQSRGIGGLLIEKGAEILAKRGTKLIFVLGHKEYYPRHGFAQNAQGEGYPTPYPDPAPPHYAQYWMIRRLTCDKLPTGRVICANTLNKPEHWQE